VNEKSGIPSILTLRTQMVKKTLKTSNHNIGIRTSTQLKCRTHKLTYDRFVLNHYAYMVMIIQEIEFTCLEKN
jgi:hypothetical protein